MRTVEEHLEQRYDGDAARVGALRERLAASAEEARTLDVAYRTVDSPVGRLLLAATPEGLLRVAFEVEGLDGVLASLAARVSPRVLLAPRRLDPAAQELEEWFSRRRSSFDLRLDLRLVGGFRRAVLDRLPSVPWGSTVSYAGLAAEVGSPRAVRAVGTACATNPLPLVVPCHRVVRGDGSLGGYLGGLDAKRALLAMEAA